jgi:transcriptional regulator GlxA family with amidase domain
VTARRASNIGFLLVPGFSLMSYAAAVEPLRAANHLAGTRLYAWTHATPGDGPVLASSGASILPDLLFGAEASGLDGMLVCAAGNPEKFDHPKTFAWLRRLARRGITIGGISGGPVILAKAGLLSGRRCTVHWEHLPTFQEHHPDVDVARSLFELDGDRITCAGGVAALDMMVALIARDHGHRLAAAVSDWLLHTEIREGVRPQRMDLGSRLGVADAAVLAAASAMEAALEEPISRQKLSAIAGVSLRRLERGFQSQVGQGIHAYYLGLRLGRARHLLTESSLSVLQVASATGFASASQFSRAFRRAFGRSPRDVASGERR